MANQDHRSLLTGAPKSLEVIVSARSLVAVCVVIGAALAAVTVGATTFVSRVDQFTTVAEGTFASRSLLLLKFASFHERTLTAMGSLVLNRFATEDEASESVLTVRPMEHQKTWELVADHPQARGSLSGMMPMPTAARRHEIWSALAIDPVAEAMSGASSDVVWFYYQSADDFIYIAPDRGGRPFHFDPLIYKQDYWTRAVPTTDPTLGMVVAGPYQDMAGQGWIVTLAKPVYANDRFLGIVAPDVHISTMQMLIGFGTAIGKSMLVSDGGRLIASQEDFTPGNAVSVPQLHTGAAFRADANGDMWMSAPIAANQLRLVHKLTRGELFAAAASDSAPTWFMISLFGLVGAIAWRLRDALAKVTMLTHHDPLTGLLNRRGLYDKLPPILAFSRRKHVSLAVLILDIDYFKSINDSYGHLAGDRILQQVGRNLLRTKRPFDLVCRWGGEEFAVVLPIDDQGDAQRVAERVRRDVMKSRTDGSGKPVTLSGGLVMLARDETIDAAIGRADRLLYAAKQGGRNRIVAHVAEDASRLQAPALGSA